MRRIIFTALTVSSIAMMALSAPAAHARSSQSQFTVSLSTTGVSGYPSTPTGLTASPVSDSEIDLSWTASTGALYGVAGYRVFRDGSFIATTTGPSYADTGLMASTSYAYYVQAFDTASNFSSSSAAVSATTLPTPPMQPAPGSSPSSPASGSSLIYGISVDAGSDSATISFKTSMPSRTALAWGLSTSYEDGSIMSILYDTDHSATLTGLKPGTHYYFGITAYADNGAKASADQMFTTASAPGASMPNPSGFTASAVSVSGSPAVSMTWINPSDQRFIKVRIVRSDSFFPRDQYDGVPVYEGAGSSFMDTGVQAGKTYYYAIFAEGQSDGQTIFSSGALAYAYLPAAGAPASVIGNPFANVPPAGNVPPAVAALSLSDFEFIQGGSVLPIHDGMIAVDASQDLTVRIGYDRMPEILKTIAVALTSPHDLSKHFIFLLRADQSRAYYTATIGPLSESGIYLMQVSILDYHDQGLKQIAGALTAYAGVSHIPSNDISQGLLWLLILFVFFLVLLSALDKARRRKAVKAAVIAVISVSAASSLVASSSPSVVHAAYNPEINYQGKLTTPSNMAVADGSYPMAFDLYTSATGGSPIWTEDDFGSNQVQVKNGLFSVMLGSTTPLSGVDFNQTLYLGVTVASDTEMTPRKIIGAVPAAFVAGTSTIALSANAIQGLTPGEFFRTDAQNATTSSNTFMSVVQNGAGKIAEFFGSAGQSALAILSNGFVGIGSSTPSTALVVSGTATVGNVVSTTTAATSSFAGNLTIGSYAYASNNSLAGGSGLNFFNLGHIVASGQGSLAFGSAQVSANKAPTASGVGSIALGYGGVTASNSGSIALGFGDFRDGGVLISSGAGSFAGGYSFTSNVTASGDGSFAFGNNVTASNQLSTAFGSGFTNSTANSFMVGYSSTPTLTVNSTSIGIGTSSPFSTLSVAGNAFLGGNLTATGTLNVSGTTTLASALNGFLQATNGVVSATSAPSLSSGFSGVLPVANGGTNASAQTTNGVNYFDGTSITSGTSLTFDGSNLSTPVLTAASTTATSFLNGGLVAGSNGALNLAAAAPANSIYVDPTGKIGLGTGSPQSAVNAQVNTTDYSTERMLIQNINATGAGYLETMNDTGSVGFIAQYGSNFSSIPDLAGNTGLGSEHSFYIFADAGVSSGGSHSINFLTGGNNPTTQTRMTIDSTGNVGIGTTSPFTTLSVAGNTFLSGNLTTTGTLNVSGQTTLASALNGFLLATNGVVSATSAPSLSSGFSGILPIANGGTNASSQIVDGVNYFDGTSITSGTSLSFNGTNLTSPYFTASSNISASTFNGSLSVNGVSHLVGNTIVGSGSAPAYALDVYPTSSNSYDLFRVGSSTAFGYAMVVKSDSRVGIGTSSPSYLLDVMPNSSNSYNLFRVGSSTGVTNALVVNSNGNVGIGTTSPFTTLSVAGNTFLSGNLTTTGTLNVSGQTTLASALNGFLLATNGVVSATSAPSLSSGFSGVLPVSNGGTGQSTFTANYALFGNGTAGLQQAANGQNLYSASTVEFDVYNSNANDFIFNVNNGGDSSGNYRTGFEFGKPGVYGTTFFAYGGNDNTYSYGYNGLSRAGAVELAAYTNGSTESNLVLSNYSSKGNIDMIVNSGNTLGLRVASTTGNVGVGDLYPATKLSVKGNAQIGYSSGQTAPTNGLLVSGSVGIGTTSPSGTLAVAGASAISGNAPLALSVFGATSLNSVAGGGIALYTGAGLQGGGGIGGPFTISTGSGGSGPTYAQGGAAGSISVTTGSGGSNTSAGSGGGAGGSLTMTLGNGGTSGTVNGLSQTVNGGTGGSFTLTAGNAGSALGVAAAGGTAGSITLNAGNGNTGGGSNSVGGNITLNPGAGGGTAAAGNVILASARGNVGIGTSSPSYKLSVAGNTYLGGNLTATGTLTVSGFGTSTMNTALDIGGTNGGNQMLTVMNPSYYSSVNSTLPDYFTQWNIGTYNGGSVDQLYNAILLSADSNSDYGAYIGTERTSTGGIEEQLGVRNGGTNYASIKLTPTGPVSFPNAIQSTLSIGNSASSNNLSNTSMAAVGVGNVGYTGSSFNSRVQLQSDSNGQYGTWWEEFAPAYRFTGNSPGMLGAFGNVAGGTDHNSFYYWGGNTPGVAINQSMATGVASSTLSVGGGAEIGTSYFANPTTDGQLLVSNSVGIGTTSPMYPLSVTDDAVVASSTNSNRIVFDANGAFTNTVDSNSKMGSSITLYADSAGTNQGGKPFTIAHRGLDSSWNVDIGFVGNSSSINFDPNGGVNYFGTSAWYNSGNKLININSSNAVTFPYASIKVGIATSSPATALDVAGDITDENVKSCDSASQALGTDSTGKVVCNTSLSDQRLKGDITSLSASSSLAMVNSLNPVSFYWKDPSIPGTGSTQLQYGFIAQQVEGVAPNLVATTSATYLTPGGTYYLNYQGVIPLLAKAIQAQQGEIGSATTSLSALTVNQSSFASSTFVTLASLSSRDDSLEAALADATGTLSEKIAALSSTTASLSALASTTASTTASALSASQAFIQSIAKAVLALLQSSGDIASATGNWVVGHLTATYIYANEVDTSKLSAQTASISNGLEMTDQTTGQIYCVQIRNGDWTKILGSCSAATSTASTDAQPPAATPVDAGIVQPAGDTGTSSQTASTSGTTAPASSGITATASSSAPSSLASSSPSSSSSYPSPVTGGASGVSQAVASTSQSDPVSSGASPTSTPITAAPSASAASSTPASPPASSPASSSGSSSQTSGSSAAATDPSSAQPASPSSAPTGSAPASSTATAPAASVTTAPASPAPAIPSSPSAAAPAPSQPAPSTASAPAPSAPDPSTSASGS